MVLIVRGLIVRFTGIFALAMSAKPSDIQIKFGHAIRRLRARLNFSQEELAYESGLDRSYIGGVERGERNPSLTVIEKIARGLDVNLSELFAECASAPRKNVRSAGSR